MGRTKTGDALDALDRRHAGDPEWDRMVQEESLKGRIAQIVYALREERDMTQTQFAELVGIHRTDISKLENADYNGSAVEMLWRICAALNKPWEILYPCGRRSACRVAIPGRRRRVKAARLSTSD